MTRTDYRKARHLARAFDRSHRHVAYMANALNDYGDFAHRPEHYHFVSQFKRCADPMLDRMRMLKRCLRRSREIAAYHAEREARNAIARAANPSLSALLDSFESNFRSIA